MEKKPLGIYVHIPFCVRKCDYCDFVSGPAEGPEIAGYVRVLLQEIHSFEALASLYRVSTVFFGGGTPSLILPRHIESILRMLRQQFDWEEAPEISIECNPGTLDEEKLGEYKTMGVNRLSIGLQSVHDSELRLLGRIHTFEDFQSNFELARRLGFRNINVDLMSGLPHQRIGAWQETLETVAALRPEHISAYSLSVEPGTPFYERYGTPIGRMSLPGEEIDREMYHLTKTVLERQGYHRYEFSNFAREGFECRHNLAYWTGGEYLGFGQSGASYVNQRRFVNPRDKAEYWKTARRAYERSKTVPRQSVKEQMEEYMFLGLRTARGISRTEFVRRFGESFPAVYEEALEKYCRDGFMVCEGDRYSLTDRGIDVSNPILADFLLE